MYNTVILVDVNCMQYYQGVTLFMHAAEISSGM